MNCPWLIRGCLIVPGVMIALSSRDNLLQEAIGVLLVSIAMIPTIYTNIQQLRTEQ